MAPKSSRRFEHTRTPHFLVTPKKADIKKGTIEIPYEFVHRFGPHLDDSIQIRCPVGKQFEVSLQRIGYTHYLTDGIEALIHYYGLLNENRLLFKKIDKRNMELVIIDSTAVEINYAHISSDDKSSESSDEEDDETFLWKSVYKCRSCGEYHSKLYKCRSCGKYHEKIQIIKKQKGLLNEDHKDARKIIHKASTSAEGKARDNLRTTPPISSTPFPSFTVTMTDAYVHKGSMFLPTDFAREHLSSGEENALLKIADGGQWTVKFQRYWRGTTLKYGAFERGWSTFVKNNDIKQSDMCTFELANTQSLQFNVKIHRHI